MWILHRKIETRHLVWTEKQNVRILKVCDLKQVSQTYWPSK